MGGVHAKLAGTSHVAEQSLAVSMPAGRTVSGGCIIQGVPGYRPVAGKLSWQRRTQTAGKVQASREHVHHCTRHATGAARHHKTARASRPKSYGSSCCSLGGRSFVRWGPAAPARAPARGRGGAPVLLPAGAAAAAACSAEVGTNTGAGPASAGAGRMRSTGGPLGSRPAAAAASRALAPPPCPGARLSYGQHAAQQATSTEAPSQEPRGASRLTPLPALSPRASACLYL